MGCGRKYRAGNEKDIPGRKHLHSQFSANSQSVSQFREGHLWFGFTKKMDDSRKNIFLGLVLIKKKNQLNSRVPTSLI